jgi:hypothetical protein
VCTTCCPQAREEHDASDNHPVILEPAVPADLTCIS